MTRKEALFELGENFNDKELGFVNNIQLICKIFDEHEKELEAMNITRREWYQKGFNEAMKQRTCEGCKYEYSDELEEPCKNCKRNTPDFYANDNA